MYKKNDYLGVDVPIHEGEKMNLVKDSLIIWKCYHNISEEEIHKFENEPVEIGVIKGMGLLLVGLKIGNESWYIFDYFYHLAKQLGDVGKDVFIEPTIDQLKEDDVLIAKMYLIEAENGRVCSKRTFPLPNKIKEIVKKALKYQKEMVVPIINSDTTFDKISFYYHITSYLETHSTLSIIKNMERVKFE